jgi:hypothetical protein
MLARVARDLNHHTLAGPHRNCIPQHVIQGPDPPRRPIASEYAACHGLRAVQAGCGPTFKVVQKDRATRHEALPSLRLLQNIGQRGETHRVVVPDNQTARRAARRDSLQVLDLGSSRHHGWQDPPPLLLCPHPPVLSSSGRPSKESARDHAAAAYLPPRDAVDRGWRVDPLPHAHELPSATGTSRVLRVNGGVGDAPSQFAIHGSHNQNHRARRTPSYTPSTS